MTTSQHVTHMVHFYDFENCATLCSIDDPGPDQIVEEERDVEVTCPTCKDRLAAFYATRDEGI